MIFYVAHQHYILGALAGNFDLGSPISAIDVLHAAIRRAFKKIGDMVNGAGSTTSTKPMDTGPSVSSRGPPSGRGSSTGSEKASVGEAVGKWHVMLRVLNLASA